MNWRQLRNHFKGKVFLIGLNFIDQEGEIIEQYQTHGTVAKLTVDGFFKIRREDNSIFTITYDKDTIKAAKEGEYREKTTGEIIKSPDFIMTWEVKTTRNVDLEDIKKRGYKPTFEYADSTHAHQQDEEE
ncbi:hypothetical protein [Fluviicola taffensis]|uniref:Uncharacterized protein n=1 Tax=Fluviicola taffensis (strain DSM 16823 / NCIMB 13979 / RW262) TaxID=755732 RepID=F2IK54_FLUTR|nr:hypothetical protein [Fluviicola taffensis]AEA42953.1 hypothetical protein Fluta_0952 [Fluviicola taffensis DSM 16823]